MNPRPATKGAYPLGSPDDRLRSVAVKNNKQSQGLGRQITREILALAKKRKVETIFLLTLTAEDFFGRFGFEKITRDDVEPVIQKTTEFSQLCPRSATVMKKKLD